MRTDSSSMMAPEERLRFNCANLINLHTTSISRNTRRTFYCWISIWKSALLAKPRLRRWRRCWPKIVNFGFNSANFWMKLKKCPSSITMGRFTTNMRKSTSRNRCSIRPKYCMRTPNARAKWKLNRTNSQERLYKPKWTNWRSFSSTSSVPWIRWSSK